MHHTIIAVDVEGFGRRDGPHQTKVREGLDTAMRVAFAHCLLPWEHCHSEDRGDGTLVFVPPDVDTTRLVECLPNELAGCLRLHNATADDQAKIRLRIVIHSGEIVRDRQGLSSPAVVHAVRLLNSSVLKEALKRSSGILATITSDEFFRNVIAPNPAADPTSYWRVAAVEKETRTTAWIALPDHHPRLRTPWWQTLRERLQPRPARRGKPARPGGRSLRTAVAALAVLLAAGILTGQPLAAAPPEDRCAEAVQLNVNVSAEKEPVVRDLAAEFEDAERDERGCKGVAVQVTVARSADAVIAAISHGWAGPEDLREVGPEPHVLLPDTSWEYDAAVQALRRVGRTDVSLDNHGSIATSPIVLARPSEDVAGGVEQPSTWEDLLASARRNPPARGARTYRPSPVTSGAGLVATVALYSAVLGKDLDRETLGARGAPRALHDLEVAVAAGDESGTLLCWLWHRPGGAVLVSEKTAADFNEGIPPGGGCSPAEGTQLHITYPNEGTFYLDHPFVTVRWHDRPLNQARERAVRRFHEYLTSAHGQLQLRRARFRDRDGDVAPFPGAPQDRPRRLTPGRVDVAAMVEAFNQAREAARVQVLVDVSESMAEPFPDVGGTRLRAAADAVGRALRSVGVRDQVGLWEFAAGLGGPADHRVRVPVRRGGTEATRKALDELRPSPRQPRVYDALRAAVAGLRGSGGPAGGSAGTSDAVLIIADGTGQERQAHTPLVDYLSARGVPVFLIAFGTGVCQSRWVEITGSTGGACHQITDIEGIDAALDNVAAVLWGGGHD